MILLQVMRYGFIALFSLALFFLLYGIASAPSREASHLGYRGLKRQKAVAEGGAWAQIEPLVRWLGTRFSGAIPPNTYQNLDKMLTGAGEYLGLTPADFVGLSVLSFFGGAAFGAIASALTGMGMLVVLCAFVGAALPYLQISSVMQERLKQVNRGLPNVTDLLALAMGAGQDFPGALRNVVEKWSDPDDAIVEECTRILHELKIGRTRKEALRDFAVRMPLDSVVQFTGSIIQAEERGNPVADVLQIQGNMARMQRTVRAEEAASKASVAMVGPLFLLFFCIMLLVVAPMVMRLQEAS